jgi:hypothetical protein
MEFCNRPLSSLKVDGATVFLTKQNPAARALETKALSKADAQLVAWARAYSQATPAERKRILALWNADPEHRP